MPAPVKNSSPAAASAPRNNPQKGSPAKANQPSSPSHATSAGSSSHHGSHHGGHHHQKAASKPLTPFQQGAKAGTACRAKWTSGHNADGRVYDAVVQSVVGDRCIVTFTGYGNSQQMFLADLLEPTNTPTPTKAAPKATTPTATKSDDAPAKQEEAAAAPAPVAEDANSPQKVVERLVAALVSAAAGEAQQAAAKELVLHIKDTAGLRAIHKLKVIESLNEAANDKKKAVSARIGFVEFFRAMIELVGQPAEPFLLQMLPTVLETVGDKNDAARAAADACITPLRELLAPRPNTAVPLLKVIFEGLKMIKWQSKLTSLQLLSSLVASAPVQIAHAMPDIVPVLTDLMWDTKPAVAEAALECLRSCCEIVKNKDLEPFIPELIKALKDPKEVGECIHQLASTTFVQTVSGAALALVAPLLLRGFRETTAVRRQSAKIASNMSKLVEQPSEAAPFLPQLMPAVQLASAETSDPEVRDVCTKTLAQLERIREAAKTERLTATSAAICEELIKLTAKHEFESDVSLTLGLAYVSQVCTLLTSMHDFELSRWQRNIVPYLTPLAPSAEAAEAVCVAARDHFKSLDQFVPEVEDDDADAEELCNCHFTLAYGSKILLHNADLKLLRGRRYGLLGANDSGKTTLMRAIANGQVDGFPPASEVNTVFVEADIQGEMSHLSCIDYIMADERIRRCGAPREKVAEVLGTVGFTEQMCNNGVWTLSGGWRMKLALARAMLQNADILLLDEPTNHLDVINVAWVQNYLNSLTNVTSIIVSHDSGLLDKCCTHILQIKDLKLNLYRGNLSSFVEKHPEARTYFDFKATKMRFKFPQPGFIQGVKSKGKALMKMTDVTFTYPGNTKPTISNITVQVSLSSRVACVGVNGAGKSTMIKLLTGELAPQTGLVWKHTGLRVAYVAQHAFHHIENHLNKTPNEYIRWRYETGEDKEGLEKVTMVETEEDIAKLRTPIQWEIKNDEGVVLRKEKRAIERLTGNRRGTDKEREYEVEWQGMRSADNSWLPRRRLEQMGCDKQLNQVDEIVLAREGMYQRPLTQPNVEKHLEDFGLEREFGSHSRISALSGGQKVKVVLGACMWNQPHIIILDEPTNYLDRDSLGALATAIREFEGGVVMITHNNEFCSQLCPETWVLEHGKLDCRGDPEWMKNAMNEAVEFKAMETMVDAMGNQSKVKAQKKELTRKERQQRLKRIQSKQANGESLDSSDEEFLENEK